MSKSSTIVETVELCAEQPESDALTELLADRNAANRNGQQAELGQVVGVTETGQALVEFAANPTPGEPLMAQSVLTESPPADWQPGEPLNVLLNFIQGDLYQPVVVGLVKPQLFAVEAKVDDRNVVIEGKESVTLKCGIGEISLRKNGKVVVKGMEVISRAKRTNKIKGGAVAIN